jgi:hypothetical protein
MQRRRSLTQAERMEDEGEAEGHHPVSLTYGCITPACVAELVRVMRSVPPPFLQLASHSRFLDIGSGVGQVVLQVQLQCSLASAIGVECVRDRHQQAQTVLQQLLDSTVPHPTLQAELDSYLTDRRLDHVRFVHCKIEEALPELIDLATHVFLFDAHFSPESHAFLLPRLWSGRPRIVVTCREPRQLRTLWSSLTPPPLFLPVLGKLELSMSGSSSSRTAYCYRTQ